jgi:hypothetical protein
MGLFVLRPVPGDRIDERLIVCLSLACRHGRGLAMGLGYELGGADVRYPDLDGAKALTAQPLPVLSYTFTGGSHITMLHVTSILSTNPRPASPWACEVPQKICPISTAGRCPPTPGKRDAMSGAIAGSQRLTVQGRPTADDPPVLSCAASS